MRVDIVAHVVAGSGMVAVVSESEALAFCEIFFDFF